MTSGPASGSPKANYAKRPPGKIPAAGFCPLYLTLINTKGERNTIHMRKANLLITLGLLVFGTVMMQAQASRTWVSGVGDDANPCSRTAPCKTWAGAISKTAAGGEIDALDPAGFGAVTITKSITLDGGGGQVASTLVSGTNGIVVSGAGINVTIRNLRINGLSGTGNGGLNGILVQNAGAVHVENVNLFAFTQDGINFSSSGGGSLFVSNTLIQDVGASGIDFGPAAGGSLFVS